jgi:hypothetical protein
MDSYRDNYNLSCESREFPETIAPDPAVSDSLASRPSPASLLSKSGLAEIAAKDGLRSIDFSSCEQFQPGPLSHMGWSAGIDTPLFNRSEDHELTRQIYLSINQQLSRAPVAEIAPLSTTMHN